jgi:hypothetical protein
MPYLIAVIAATLAFVGFLLLTTYEAKRGTRFFASARYRLDRKAGRMFFVAGHVDWGAFSAHVARTTFTTIAHDVAHGTLIGVRSAERLLTRAVRTLRIRRDDAASLPGQNGSPAGALEASAPSTEASAAAPTNPSRRQAPARETTTRERSPETVIDAPSVRVIRPVRGPASSESAAPEVERRRPSMLDIRPPSRRG